MHQLQCIFQYSNQKAYHSYLKTRYNLGQEQYTLLDSIVYHLYNAGVQLDQALLQY
jgi:hypothetical protein